MNMQGTLRSLWLVGILGLCLCRSMKKEDLKKRFCDAKYVFKIRVISKAYCYQGPDPQTIPQTTTTLGTTLSTTLIPELVNVTTTETPTVSSDSLPSKTKIILETTTAGKDRETTEASTVSETTKTEIVPTTNVQVSSKHDSVIVTNGITTTTTSNRKISSEVPKTEIPLTSSRELPSTTKVSSDAPSSDSAMRKDDSITATTLSSKASSEPLTAPSPLTSGQQLSSAKINSLVPATDSPVTITGDNVVTRPSPISDVTSTEFEAASHQDITTEIDIKTPSLDELKSSKVNPTSKGGQFTQSTEITDSTDSVQNATDALKLPWTFSQESNSETPLPIHNEISLTKAIATQQSNASLTKAPARKRRCVMMVHHQEIRISKKNIFKGAKEIKQMKRVKDVDSRYLGSTIRLNLDFSELALNKNYLFLGREVPNEDFKEHVFMADELTTERWRKVKKWKKEFQSNYNNAC